MSQPDLDKLTSELEALALEPESEEPVAIIDGMEILDSEDGK